MDTNLWSYQVKTTQSASNLSFNYTTLINKTTASDYYLQAYLETRFQQQGYFQMTNSTITINYYYKIGNGRLLFEWLI